MSTEEQRDNNVKATIDAVTGLAKAIPVYQDAVQPAAKEIGKSLEIVTKTVNIALAPIKALVWGYEKIEDYLNKRVAEKLREIPKENIVTPPPQVAGPAVEALRYSGHDENLRELYANLLATAMNKETTDKAHPGFVEIIKNLSSEEGLLLQAFAVRRTYPLVDVDGQDEGTVGTQTYYRNFSRLHDSVPVADLYRIPTYLDNLCRLGILEVLHGFTLTAPDTYEPLETSSEIKPFIKRIEEHGRVVNFYRKMIQLTSFGQEFIDHVVTEK